MRYYLDRLKIEKTKFPLDRHQYILFADYERIRMYRQEAIERSEPATEHMPVVKKEAA
jgi:hypothetical protein